MVDVGWMINRCSTDFRQIFDRCSIDFGWFPVGVSGLLVGVGRYLVDTWWIFGECLVDIWWRFGGYLVDIWWLFVRYVMDICWLVLDG